VKDSTTSTLSPATGTREPGDAYNVTLQPAGVVRDLGVLLDNQLTIKQHVNRVASSCFFHLRRLRQIKRHVTPEAMNQLVTAVILGRLDYCNSALAGLPWSTVAPLQRVQNAAARLVLGLSPRDHVSLALLELHWLPVYYRMQFKLGLLMYMAHNTMDSRRCTLATPGRQSVAYHLVGDYALLTQQTTWCPRHVLSSGKEHSVFPGFWSGTLSPSHVDSVTTFRRRLKTHFFNIYLS